MGDLRVPDLNKVIIAGRLTSDPDLKQTASGLSVGHLRIANTRYYKNRDGEKNEETCFVDVTLWDKQATWAAERLKKGRPVIVEGNLKTDQWEDRETGQKRSKIEINAYRVVPLDWDEDLNRENPKPNPNPNPKPKPTTYVDEDIPF